MLKAVSPRVLKALVLVLGAALSACGAPLAEEGTQEKPAAEQAPSEQGPVTAMDHGVHAPVSSLTCTRNTYSGETLCTNSASGGTAPLRYFWQFKENYSYNGTYYVSGWYEGSNTETFYCPRASTREAYNWSLTVEAYVQDANGYVSTIVSRGYPCSEAY